MERVASNLTKIIITIVFLEMAMIGLIQVFVAFIFFLVFNCSFLHKKSYCQPVLKNWPFLISSTGPSRFLRPAI